MSVTYQCKRVFNVVCFSVPAFPVQLLWKKNACVNIADMLFRTNIFISTAEWLYCTEICGGLKRYSVHCYNVFNKNHFKNIMVLIFISF